MRDDAYTSASLGTPGPRLYKTAGLWRRSTLPAFLRTFPDPKDPLKHQLDGKLAKERTYCSGVDLLLKCSLNGCTRRFKLLEELRQRSWIKNLFS